MKMMNKSKVYFWATLILFGQSLKILAQPGPNWAAMLNYNKVLMSTNGIREALCITFETDDVNGLFRDVYHEDGLMDTCYDFSLIEVEGKMRIFVSRATFAYFEDSVRVTGEQGGELVVELDSIERAKWTDYVYLQPKIWDQNYSFLFGKDAEGFYKFDGIRIYNTDGTLDRIDKKYNDELVSQKKYNYEDKKLIREDRYKKTYYEGYKKELEVHYSYTSAGMPDSSYTIQLVDFGGKADTTVAGVIRKIYDKKNRLVEEIVVTEGRLKNVTTYNYDIEEDGKFKLTLRDGRGYLQEERIYTKGGLELEKKIYHKVDGMIGEARSIYIPFKEK